MRAATSVLCLALAAVAGCDLPTGSPVLEQRWVVPGEETTIAVDELLPDGVTSSGDAFQVEVEAFEASESLGDLCPACVPLDGLIAPKPAFHRSFDVTRSLPERVVEGQLSSGSIRLHIQNGFSFDPLRPEGGSTGTVTITVSNQADGSELVRLVLDGDDRALPPGATVEETVSLAPGPLGSVLAMTVDVRSPAGAPVEIDVSERITATAHPTSTRVSSATLEVGGEEVLLEEVALEVEEIDPGVTDRIQEGAIVLEIANPFAVPVDARFDIDFPGGVLSRDFEIGPDAGSTVRLDYTGDELRRFLGRSDVTASGAGTVSPEAPPTTATPGQKVTIDATLDVTLRVGS